MTSSQKGVHALKHRLSEIRAQQPDLESGMIAEVVRAVLATMSGDLTAKETSLLPEVEELGRTIATAKSEIAALRVDDITDHDIPFATDELDAIVAHTAQATHAILESCEMLDEVTATVTASRRRNCRPPPRGSTRRAASRTSPASASPRWSPR